ncbi:hypothetical protein EW146_g5255 [Bondarzewia mesenterica]|uniref:Uncharacterized protein n=1 Tax=Bondarzewia mesenterica TaxID=1095465 RepID=A0A4S4LS13_9AGAM|nr:hypothetical protein EW146_g5255 [Bondarzewia mesenterica]
MSSDSLELSDDVSFEISSIIGETIPLAVETGFYSLWAAFFALSTYFLACKGFNFRTNLTMWLVTVIMFLVSTCHYASSCVIAFSDVLSDLQILVYPSILDIFDDSVVFQQMSDVQTYLPITNYILSDAVLLWRAWVLWDRNIKVMIVPALMWFTTAVVAFVSVGLLGMGYATIIFGMIASTLPLATNIVATSLIAFKAWKYSRSIKAYLGDGSPLKLKAGAILALLAESGFLYCAIWIVYIISLFSPISIFTRLTQAIMVHISGIYPTVVIVLVALQKTAWDMTASIEGVQSVFQVATHPPPATRFSLSMNDQPNHSPIIQIGFNPPVTTHDDDGCKEIAGAREESGIV